MVRLGDLAAFIRGITFRPDDLTSPLANETVRCLRTKNIQDPLDTTDVLSVASRLVKRPEQFLEEGDILVSTANSANLVGKCSWIPAQSVPTTFGGFVCALRGDESLVNRRYLYHWFSSQRIQHSVRGLGRQTTNISNLDLGRCQELPVPLPPLSEQERLVAVLDQGVDLRVRRHQTSGLFKGLRRSIFKELHDADRWPKYPLGDLLLPIESGSSPVCAKAPVRDDEWGVLKLGAISTGSYIPSENKALLPGISPIAQNEVRGGDVLLTRKNTRQLVGRSVFVESTPPHLLIPDLIFRLVPSDPQILGSRYLQAALDHPSTRAAILSRSGGSAGSMPNISKARLSTVEIGVPPIELQRLFADRMAEIDTLERLGKSQAKDLERLFVSLQSQVFKGSV